MDIIATAPQASVSSARPGGASKPEADQGEFDALLDSQAKDDGAIAPETPARADTPSKDDAAADDNASFAAPAKDAEENAPREEATTDGSEVKAAPAAPGLPVAPAPVADTVSATTPVSADAKSAAPVASSAPGPATPANAPVTTDAAPVAANNSTNAAGAAGAGSLSDGASPELMAQADKALNTRVKSDSAAPNPSQTGAAKAAVASAAAGANANTNANGNGNAGGNTNGGASNGANNSAATAHASSVAKAAASPSATPLAAAPAAEAAASADAAAQAGDGGEAVAELRQLTSGASAPHANAAGAARDAAVVRWDPSAIAAFAARFARRAADGATRFELRMDPPELGRVDVKLDIDAEGRARAQLTVERPETLAEMTRHARQLERALSEAGVELGEDGVQFQLAADAGGDMSDETFAANDQASPASRVPANDAHAETAPPAPVEFDAGGYAVLPRARLDIRA